MSPDAQQNLKYKNMGTENTAMSRIIHLGHHKTLYYYEKDIIGQITH